MVSGVGIRPPRFLYSIAETNIGLRARAVGILGFEIYLSFDFLNFVISTDPDHSFLETSLNHESMLKKVMPHPVICRPAIQMAAIKRIRVWGTILNGALQYLMTM